MRTYLDCVPCFFRQALDAARLSGCGHKEQKKMLLKLAEYLPLIDMRLPPPEINRRIIEHINGSGREKKDAYAKVRSRSIRMALKAYSYLKKTAGNAVNGVKRAVEIAIEGNIIDYGASSPEDAERKMKILFVAGKAGGAGRKGRFDFREFNEELLRARTILYLADNAGETVFDRVLTEYIKEKHPNKRIFYAVKGAPAINDALQKDAYESGLQDSTKIVSSGSDAPGTVLSRCTEDFKRLFSSADLVISKGQGNYEALSGEKRRIFFMFVAKCGVIARHAGCKPGDRVLIRRGR